MFQEFREGQIIRSAYANRLKMESPESSGIVAVEDAAADDASMDEMQVNKYEFLQFLTLSALPDAHPSSHVREAIVGLLVSSLERAGYNLGLFLLGFEATQGVDKLELEKGPAWDGSCLNVLLKLMAAPSFLSSHPALCTACFHLLFRLCTNKQTSRTVMRCLRSRQQGISHHKRPLSRSRI